MLLAPTPMELAGGVTADLLLGDPRWLPHPVAGLGRWASWSERMWRASPLPGRLAGIAAWITIAGTAAGVVYATVRWLPPPFISIYWIFSLLSARSLDDHAMAVIRALRQNDLPAARQALAWIVGRDTGHLDEREVTRGVIETVAENLSDGVVAPLFWLAVGGPVGMALYKAVNTMDSMFGYKNDRYREFGWFAARVDDWANLIPARLTALLIWIAAALLPGLDARASARITRRDGHRQPSPNSGYPEAAAAGALGVRLGGVNYYRGVISHKEFLGEERIPLTWRVYRPMRQILFLVTAMAAALVLLVALR